MRSAKDLSISTRSGAVESAPCQLNETSVLAYVLTMGQLLRAWSGSYDGRKRRCDH